MATSALLLALLAAQLLECRAELMSLTVNVSNVTHEVEPRTLGCHSDNGYVHNSRALYSEMLYGVCFDGGLSSWGTLTLPAGGTVSTDAATQLHNKTSLKLALADGSPRVAVANRGLGNAGLVFHAGQPYTASMWASSATGAAGHVLVAALVSRQTNTTLAKAVVPLSGIGSQWQWLNFSLTPSASTSCVAIEPGSDPSISRPARPKNSAQRTLAGKKQRPATTGSAVNKPELVFEARFPFPWDCWDALLAVMPVLPRPFCLYDLFVLRTHISRNFSPFNILICWSSINDQLVLPMKRELLIPRHL
jgi:hypothetical protein